MLFPSLPPSGGAAGGARGGTQNWTSIGAPAIGSYVNCKRTSCGLPTPSGHSSTHSLALKNNHFTRLAPGRRGTHWPFVTKRSISDLSSSFGTLRMEKTLEPSARGPRPNCPRSRGLPFSRDQPPHTAASALRFCRPREPRGSHSRRHPPATRRPRTAESCPRHRRRRPPRCRHQPVPPTTPPRRAYH